MFPDARASEPDRHIQAGAARDPPVPSVPTRPSDSEERCFTHTVSFPFRGLLLFSLAGTTAAGAMPDRWPARVSASPGGSSAETETAGGEARKPGQNSRQLLLKLKDLVPLHGVSVHREGGGPVHASDRFRSKVNRYTTFRFKGQPLCFLPKKPLAAHNGTSVNLDISG